MKKLLSAVFILIMVMMIPAAYGYSGSAICKWTPPTTFADGSALVPAVDLQGFNVKCGATHGGPYPTAVNVPGGTSTQISIPIPVGTTYCVVSAVTTSVYGGLESANSVEASKTITAPAGSGCKTFTME